MSEHYCRKNCIIPCFVTKLQILFVLVSCFGNRLGLPASSFLCFSTPRKLHPRASGFKNSLFHTVQEKRPFLSALRLYVPNPWAKEDEKDIASYDSEETLMHIHLSAMQKKEAPANAKIATTTTTTTTIKEALRKVQKFTQSFPFGTVLPAQPLHYLPTGDGGVQVSFLRDKAKEDGGVRFFVQQCDNNSASGLEIVAKRNSKGQTEAKLSAEKKIVKAYIDAITGKELTRYGRPPSDIVSVESIFHKRMF